MTTMKKMTLAISIDVPAMPPKPRRPAINARIRKVTTQLNMTRSSATEFGSGGGGGGRPARHSEKQSSLGTKVPGRETGKFASLGERNRASPDQMWPPPTAP